MLDKKIISKIAASISNPIVFFDTETTGVYRNIDEIIQLAAIKILPDKSVQTLELWFKPSKPIPAAATSIHHIRDEDVSEKLPISHYAERIVAFFGGADIAGFNIAFDIDILDRQLAECGYPNVFADVKIYDAMKVFFKHAPRNLASAHNFYLKSQMEDAHNAMGDILATVNVTAAQLDIEGKPLYDTVEKKSSNEQVVKVGDSYVLNFGKHKGIDLSKVDKGYLRWFVTKAEFASKDAKNIVAKYL